VVSIKVQGFPDGKFETNDSVTLEQVVTILYRYAKDNGLDVRMSGCQHVRMSACQDVSMPGCQDVSMSGCQHVSMSADLSGYNHITH
jgi:hypothetical protein